MSETAPATRTRVTAPGIYDMPEADYHADPCPAPSLSRTVLKRIVDFSARHGYVMHPHLGGRTDDELGSDDEVQDFGTAAHSSFLQGKSNIRCLNFPDWRTNKAKEARAQAYADGQIPLLTKAYGRAMRLIEELVMFQARTGAFTKGKPEQTIVWRDGSIWCRARVDWLPDDPEAHTWDLKTTAGAANAWGRTCFDRGADLQDSFYSRGLEMVRGEPPAPMKFAVIEQSPPYGLKVFEMSPIARDLADEDVRLGLDIWSDCLASGEFANYPIETEWIDPPPWVLRSREARVQISPRNLDLLRGREHPNAVQYTETGNFGG